MPVYKDKKKGYWYVMITENYKQKKITLWKGDYLLSKAAAQQAEYEYTHLKKNTTDKTMLDLYHEYIRATKSNLKPSTMAGYIKFENLYFYCNKKIKLVKSIDIIEWKEKIAAIDSTTPYKNRLLNILKNLLDYGSRQYGMELSLQECLLQPLKNNDIIDLEPKDKYLPPNEFKALIKPIDEIGNALYYKTILIMLYNTGLRIGELAALTINDIKTDYILVNKDYIRVAGKDIIQPPKNQNSVRKVFLDQYTKSVLEDYILQYHPNDVLFHLESEYLNQQKLRRVIAALQEETGLCDYTITPHTLRHSHASNLRHLGFDEYAISKRLGNTPTVAAKIYIHSNDDESVKIAEKLIILT